MEWFSHVDDGDLVVPKGLDGFSPSSDSWSQWDSTPFGNFKSEMKRHNIRSSFLKDCPTGMAATDESSDLSTDADCSMLLDDDQVRDMTSNGCAGTAKYFSAHAFTPPVSWESQEVNNSYLSKKVMLLFISCTNSNM